MVRFSVNYIMNFGIDVSQKDIDKKRKWLQAMYDCKDCENDELLWDMKINKDSTDSEIAKFIGIQNVSSAEAVDLEFEGMETYDEKREKELDQQDIERHEEFKKNNPDLFNKINKKDAEMIIDLIRLNAKTDKFLHTEYYLDLATKLENHFRLRKAEN